MGNNPQLEIRRLMKQEFCVRNGRNPKYSLRAFSNKLGISPAATSQIMNGDRTITRKMAHKILVGLDVTSTKTFELLGSLKGSKALASDAKPYLQLESDKMEVAGNWFYYAILSLAETKSFKSDPLWISRRLNISPQEARSALERLVRLNLLKQESSGKLKATGVQLSSGTGELNLFRRRHNIQNLEMAQKALSNVPLEFRDFSHMTMALDPSKISIAKEYLQSFRRQFCELMESTDKKEVYKLSIQFFPLTNLEEL